MWWLFWTIITGGVGEIIGWSARVWSAKDPLASVPFLMQICCTIISPTWILAANFIITGRLIGHLGSQYSRLRPKFYTILFCSCDAIALVIQAVGGGTASSASDSNGTKMGANIMLAGIVFQLAAITVYTLLTAEFLLRFMYRKPFSGREDSQYTSRLVLKLQLMLSALVLSILCMFIRAVYRTIELSDGWTGRIISTELYFLVLDGGMIIIAMVTMNVFHPGLLMKDVTPTHKVNSRSSETVEMSTNGH